MLFYTSIRLELIRDGIQDYEKLTILENQLSKSASRKDQKSLKMLQNKLKEYSILEWEPGEMTLLIESSQEMIRNIIRIRSAPL